jgi:hypothetical protein
MSLSDDVSLSSSSPLCDNVLLQFGIFSAFFCQNQSEKLNAEHDKHVA